VFAYPDSVHNVVGLKLTEDSQFHNTASLKIIIAEDHDVNQKLLVRILQKLGYDVEVAENGLEVLELLKQAPFDLIFMDLQMPEMDGFIATKAIMENVPKEQIPIIIAVTASASQDDIDHCAALGMSGFISKPIKIKSIQKVLEQHFSER
jgi:CheY-like chemotaxis protein